MTIDCNLSIDSENPTQATLKQRSRGWCFTVNNYTEDDIIDVFWLYEGDTNSSYLVVGFEICPRTKTPHLQCYVYYTNAVSFSSMKKALPTAHIEAQKARKEVTAYAYCMEDDDYIEFGNRPVQGQRTDIAVMMSDIRKGRPAKDMIRQYPNQWVQYRRSFDAYDELLRNYDTKMVLYNPKDPKHVKEIWTRSNMKHSKICTQFDSHDLLNIYYCRKYYAIYVPNQMYDLDLETIQDLCDEVIDI